MAESLPAALRERLRPVPLLLWFALMGGLYVVFDGSSRAFAATAASTVVFGATDVLIDVYDLSDAVERLVIGSCALAAGTVLWIAGEPPSAVLVTITIGGWFALDGIQTIRHEGLYDATETDDRDGRSVYREYVARRVDAALREQPRTRLELSDVLDADDAEIDRAIAALLETGRIERAGSELRVPDRSEPSRKRAVGAVRSLLRRIARPVTIEFGRETR